MCFGRFILKHWRERSFLLAAAIAIACQTLGAVPGGTPLWTNRYRGTMWGSYSGRAITSGTNGSVFVAGSSGGGSANDDWVTLAYSANGVALWTNYYAGPGKGLDLPNAITFAAGGKVVITGSSDGGINSYRDFLTIGYSSAGTALWTNRYSSPSNQTDVALAVAVATNGNAVVTGYAWDGGDLSSSACVTIAYASSGLALWTNRYRGPANGSDSGSAIAIGTNGNIFVAGTSANLGSGYDYLTLAYSPAGAGLWTNRFNRTGNENAVASAIAVDASDQVFVTGYATGASGRTVCLTIAYSGSGAPLWTNVYEVPGGSALGKAVATDQSGIVVAGFAGVGPNYDFLTLAYAATGEPLWTNLYNGPANDDDAALALALDGGGNAIVTGPSRGSNNLDYATVAYSIASGLALWTNRYDGPGVSVDESRAICVDPDGNVFVTGQSIGPGGDFDILTVKYSSSARPHLECRRNGAQMILSWRGAASSLQSAFKVDGVFTNIPGAISPYTNRLSSSQQYFRLVNR